MFSLDENFFLEIVSLTCVDFYPVILGYLSGIFLFLEGTRSQIPDIELLQLVPGSYFLLCLLSLILFSLQSQLLNRIPFELDLVKSIGTKIKNKMEINILLTISFFLFSNVVLISSNTIIPLSLDYFINSGEKTLQNFWSLTEVIELETLIFLFLILFSQIPLFFISNGNTLQLVKIVSKFWKLLLFLMTIVAGILTPTLDGSTQLNFVSFILSFYLFLVNSVQKKSFLKFNIFLSFGG
jgi:hypothetical protein